LHWQVIFTEDYRSQILADTKMLLGIDDDSKDEILTFIIDDTINMVLAYCRIEILPRQLLGLISQMAANVYERLDFNDGISSITEGDRKIEYRGRAVFDEYRFRLKPFVNVRGTLPSEVQRS